MKAAWLVVREEKHIDQKFWVCESRDDALRIAADVTAYWKEEYDPSQDECDEELCGTQIFNFCAEDMFRVWVEPVSVRQSGEHAITEEIEKKIFV